MSAADQSKLDNVFVEGRNAYLGMMNTFDLTPGMRGIDLTIWKPTNPYGKYTIAFMVWENGFKFERLQNEDKFRREQRASFNFEIQAIQAKDRQTWRSKISKVVRMFGWAK